MKERKLAIDRNISLMALFHLQARFEVIAENTIPITLYIRCFVWKRALYSCIKVLKLCCRRRGIICFQNYQTYTTDSRNYWLFLSRCNRNTVIKISLVDIALHRNVSFDWQTHHVPWKIHVAIFISKIWFHHLNWWILC